MYHEQAIQGPAVHISNVPALQAKDFAEPSAGCSQGVYKGMPLQAAMKVQCATPAELAQGKQASRIRWRWPLQTSLVLACKQTEQHHMYMRPGRLQAGRQAMPR